MADLSQPGPHELRELKRSWIIAALIGSAFAGLLAAGFVVFSPAPPRFPVVLPPLAPVDAQAEPAPPIASESASLAVSVEATHEWPEVEGLDRAAAAKTLASHDHAIRECWPAPPPLDSAVARPSLLVRMTVASGGKISELQIVESDIEDTGVTSCIEGVLRSLHFRRAPGKDATVSMLWKF